MDSWPVGGEFGYLSGAGIVIWLPLMARTLLGQINTLHIMLQLSDQGHSVPYARTQVLPHRFDNLKNEH